VDSEADGSPALDPEEQSNVSSRRLHPSRSRSIIHPTGPGLSTDALALLSQLRDWEIVANAVADTDKHGQEHAPSVTSGSCSNVSDSDGVIPSPPLVEGGERTSGPSGELDRREDALKGDRSQSTIDSFLQSAFGPIDQVLSRLEDEQLFPPRSTSDAPSITTSIRSLPSQRSCASPAIDTPQTSPTLSPCTFLPIPPSHGILRPQCASARLSMYDSQKISSSSRKKVRISDLVTIYSIRPSKGVYPKSIAMKEYRKALGHPAADPAEGRKDLEAHWAEEVSSLDYPLAGY
jgi:hypothetical protein